MTEPSRAAAPILRSTHVPRSPEDAFRIFTEEIGAWWPLPTHGVFGAESGGLVFRDDALVEIALDGREATWGTVTTWEPPTRLAFTWHPGRDADEASIVDLTFDADDHGCRVVLEHHGWEAFGEFARARRRPYVGPGAWGSVLDHYADCADPAADRAELDDLRTAQERFIATAAEAGEGEDADGGWNADEVIAHVSLNDAAMIAVAQALVHGHDVRFENNTCQDRHVLGRWIDAAGSRDELVRRCAAMGTAARAAFARLSPEQRSAEVHCRLSHDGEIVLDAPRPWQAIALHAQSDMHLPAHVAQLEALPD